jgi:hypothetical protein
MKKFIVLVVVCCLSNLGFTQNMTRLDHSDLGNNQFIQTNNLEDFSLLATSAEVGVAYIDQNQVRTYNKEKGIQLIRVNSNNLQFLNSNLNFANAVELIVINVSKSGFNIQSIDCSKLEQFKNLKYIYFVFQTNQIENKKIPSLNCITDNIAQYYTNERPI